MAGRKKIERKSKRNNFTLSHAAQMVIDNQKNKSKFVSEAIIEKDYRDIKQKEDENSMDQN